MSTPYFNALPINENAVKVNDIIEKGFNFAIRSVDRTKQFIGLKGRSASYDDEHFEFVGGAKDALRKKHYDKSLRLLWKAEKHMSWSSFKDMTKEELQLESMAQKSMNSAEKKERERINSEEFRQFLKDTYSERERVALVRILSIIGHGEAYAWLVSSDLLNIVKSTGARAALTMQVVEEAKHFLVLRELLFAFDVEIPRQSGYEYILLENVHKARGLEKFFGMNVLIEGIALSLFGMVSHLPGLEILRMFHLDEARHTALPKNYYKEFPLTNWQKSNPITSFNRVKLILPVIPLIFYMEKELAVLGIDAFDFGGSAGRKIFHLADSIGLKLPVKTAQFQEFLNSVFNAYCKISRKDHETIDFFTKDTTIGKSEKVIEKEVFEMVA